MSILARHGRGGSALWQYSQFSRACRRQQHRLWQMEQPVGRTSLRDVRQSLNSSIHGKTQEKSDCHTRGKNGCEKIKSLADGCAQIFNKGCIANRGSYRRALRECSDKASTSSSSLEPLHQFQPISWVAWCLRCVWSHHWCARFRSNCFDPIRKEACRCRTRRREASLAQGRLPEAEGDRCLPPQT